MDQREPPVVPDSVAVLEDAVLASETKFLWVFGYGSLCWRPGFDFHKAVIGHVQGYNRRFWQGNTTHRGTEEKPGRVATLVQHNQGKVHGVAFAISGEAALPYLAKRECDLGGYSSHFTKFYPANGEPFNVLLYIATPKNQLWLGEADVSVIANEIMDCSGPSGHNVEYLLRLTDFMRHHFPAENDHHLFDLEKQVVAKINDNRMCLQSLMGDGRGCLTFIKAPPGAPPPRQQEEEDEEPERVENFQHTTRVSEKSLRCLNI